MSAGGADDDLTAHLAALGFALERGVGSELERDAGLALRDLHEPKMLPLRVDFLEAKIIHRLKHGLSKSQPLPRALGLKSLNPDQAPFVFDATAGLGTDAFFIAALGCRVRAVERNPVVFALIEDALLRLRTEVAREDSEAPALGLLRGINERLTFENGDAAAILEAMPIGARPDVVYLDPMYPEEGRSESALPKKAMQMFRRLIGDDADADEVFHLARRRARERVVVKRPLRAPPLGGTPTHVFKGKTARFDMYLAN